MRAFFESSCFKHFLGQHFRWYRRWYGGRWERPWIDICGSFIWLDMHPDRKWPEYRQPCSLGTPEIEDHEQRAAVVPKER